MIRLVLEKGRVETLVRRGDSGVEEAGQGGWRPVYFHVFP